MRKSAFILIPLLLMSFGCTAHRTIFSPGKGISDAKLTPRTVPAKLSKESEQSLTSKGYVRIGSVSSTDETSSCWGDDCKNFTCSDRASSRDLTKDIVEAAASGGGDLVVLQQDRAVSSKQDSRQGKCLSSSSSQYTEQECSGGYGNVARVCRNVTKTRYTCTSWEYISGRTCVTTSSGMVWRYDPELPKRLAEIERETKRAAAEAARKKQRFLNLKNTYEANLKRRQKSSDMVPFKSDGKYGFKDKNGKVAIQPQFTDMMGGFLEGLAAVSVGEKDEKKWGFIDKKGEWIVQPLYEFAGNFSEGVADVRINKKYGYIDKTGQFVISPQFFTTGPFVNGIAWIYSSENKKLGYIDRTGNIIIKPQFDWPPGSFYDGMAPVKAKDKFGYIDKTGNYVIQSQLSEAGNFLEGIAKVKIGDKEGYINKEGEVFLED